MTAITILDTSPGPAARFRAALPLIGAAIGLIGMIGWAFRIADLTSFGLTVTMKWSTAVVLIWSGVGVYAHREGHHTGAAIMGSLCFAAMSMVAMRLSPVTIDSALAVGHVADLPAYGAVAGFGWLGVGLMLGNGAVRKARRFAAVLAASAVLGNLLSIDALRLGFVERSAPMALPTALGLLAISVGGWWPVRPRTTTPR